MLSYILEIFWGYIQFSAKHPHPFSIGAPPPVESFLGVDEAMLYALVDTFRLCVCGGGEYRRHALRGSTAKTFLWVRDLSVMICDNMCSKCCNLVVKLTNFDFICQPQGKGD